MAGENGNGHSQTRANVAIAGFVLTLLLGAVSYGTLRQQVTTNSTELDKVRASVAPVGERLGSIEAKLDILLRRQP